MIENFQIILGNYIVCAMTNAFSVKLNNCVKLWHTHTCLSDKMRERERERGGGERARERERELIVSRAYIGLVRSAVLVIYPFLSVT